MKIKSLILNFCLLMLELLRPQKNHLLLLQTYVVSNPTAGCMFFGCRLLVGDRHADYSIIKGQPSSLTVSEGRILIKKTDGKE